MFIGLWAKKLQFISTSGPNWSNVFKIIDIRRLFLWNKGCKSNVESSFIDFLLDKSIESIPCDSLGSITSYRMNDFD